MINGLKIKHLRMQKGWEQRELALAAQVNPSVVSRLEKGLQQDFKLSVVGAIAKALGVSIDSLIVDEHRSRTDDLSPDVRSLTMLLSQYPEAIQEQVVAIARCFLSTIEKGK